MMTTIGMATIGMATIGMAMIGTITVRPAVGTSSTTAITTITIPTEPRELVTKRWTLRTYVSILVVEEHIKKTSVCIHTTGAHYDIMKTSRIHSKNSITAGTMIARPFTAKQAKQIKEVLKS